MTTVPRLWPQATIVCLATGPSLTAADVDACRGRARLIAIKDAIRLAPDADVLYGAGGDNARWWQKHGPTLQAFAGLRYALHDDAATWATVLRNTGPTGLERDPGGLKTGKNSGYQAINLAVHLGAARILLLGYDQYQAPNGPKYFFGNRPATDQNRSPFVDFLPTFETLVAPLQALGVSVVNCSRETKLTCFPRRPLAEVLDAEVAA